MANVLHVGMDFHLHTTSLCALEPDGAVAFEKTLRGHWQRAVHWLQHYARRHDAQLHVCFEASCGSGALYDQLAGFATRVVVAHPGKLRLIYQSKRKNDSLDAQRLAKLLLIGAVPAAYIPDVNMRAWRGLIEFRQRQVRQRTRVKNQLRSLLRQHGVVVPRRPGLWSRQGLTWLHQVSWPSAAIAMQCQMLLLQLEQIEQAIRQVTAKLDRLAQDHPGVARLRTIPGVGPRTAEAFAAYVDDPHRFTRLRQIGAYLGLVPSQDSSAGRNRLGHITKQGPASLRHLLVEAAWGAVRRCPAMREEFDRIAAGKRERRRIALIAVAHKLSRVMLAMLREEKDYSPTPASPTDAPALAAAA